MEKASEMLSDVRCKSYEVPMKWGMTIPKTFPGHLKPITEKVLPSTGKKKWEDWKHDHDAPLFYQTDLPVCSLYADSPGVACLFFCHDLCQQEIRALNKQGENSLEALYSQLDLVVDSIMEQENGVANNAHMTVALKKILSNDDYISYSDAVSIRSINLFLDSLVQAYEYLSSIYLYFDGYGSYFFSGKNVKNITEADENWLSIYKGMEEGTDGAARLREWTEDKGGEVLSVYRKLLIQDGVMW